MHSVCVEVEYEVSELLNMSHRDSNGSYQPEAMIWPQLMNEIEANFLKPIWKYSKNVSCKAETTDWYCIEKLMSKILYENLFIRDCDK